MYENLQTYSTLARLVRGASKAITLLFFKLVHSNCAYCEPCALTAVVKTRSVIIPSGSGTAGFKPTNVYRPTGAGSHDEYNHCNTFEGCLVQQKLPFEPELTADTPRHKSHRVTIENHHVHMHVGWGEALEALAQSSR